MSEVVTCYPEGMSRELAQQVERMRRQQSALVDLARAGGLPDDVVRRVVKVAGDTLDVARSSVWLLSDDRQSLSCLSLFERPSRVHSGGAVLSANQYPRYFAALESGRAIDAHDARSDPRTDEFRDGYLVPLGITAMLDSAVRVGGEIVGVLCCESIGADRTWSTDEIGFVGALADQVALARAEAQRRQLEGELLQAQKLEALGRLSAGIAHEINNPLAYVQSNLDFIAVLVSSSESGIAPEVSDAVQEALQGLQRVASIVHGLGQFSRRSGQDRRPVDVAAAIDAASRISLSEVRHRARLVVEVSPVPSVLADETGLVQVLLNLLVNAAQAIGEGDAARNEIRVSAVRRDDAVEIAIRDTGGGIPPEVLDHIFDPFFTSKPPGKGTGLGLSISHAIVKSFGGQLRLESALGLGTTAIVRLPFGEEASASPPIDSAPPSRLGRARCLFIDDEEALIRCMCRYLQKSHDVTGVTSGAAALALLQAGERYDVILCDLMMPGMTGIEFHQHVERWNPEVARTLIFMTGGALTTDAEEFLRNNENDRLVKPFPMGHLRRTVEARLPA